MIALIQRVSQASVTVSNEVIAEIGKGLLVLFGVEKDDAEMSASRLVERLLNYRIFEDDAGKMNLSVTDIDGQLLVVPQFTLAADTRKGNRPSFSSAAHPDTGKRLYDYFTRELEDNYPGIQTGQFGAEMQVALINDGPVTFTLRP